MQIGFEPSCVLTAAFVLMWPEPSCLKAIWQQNNPPKFICNWCYCKWGKNWGQRAPPFMIDQLVSIVYNGKNAFKLR